MTLSGLGGRTLPRGLAALVTALERDGADLVTLDEIDALRRAEGLATPAKVLASRLRDRGWLLATPARGVYEFSPGAHAGAFSRGSLVLPLRAVLRAHPDLRAGLTLQSAAWALGAADRAPARLEIAAPDGSAVAVLSRALGERARVLVFAPRLGWERRRGVPTLAPDSLLVHMAARPRDVRSWSSALEWLPDIAAEADAVRLRAELAHRPRAVTTRLAYLLSGLRPELAEDLDAELDAAGAAGKVYFGGRGPLRRHDASRQVADTVLPFDPRTLAPAPR